MREIVDSNYIIDISYARLPEEVAAYLPGAYDIRINQSLDVVVLPWLPATDWPDPLPIESEDVRNRDDAAWLATGQADIAVVPTRDGTERIEKVTRTDVDGAVNVIVWLGEERHARLRQELSHRMRAPLEGGQGRETRLAQVADTELGRFLTEVLPDAVVDPRQRKFLVLPEAAISGRSSRS